MKILASIPVEKISTSTGTFTYRCEDKEVEVERLIRHRADSTRPRYYYVAIIKNPRSVIPFDNLAFTSGRFNVNRKLNPKWRPPEFPEGKDVLDIVD